MTTIRTIPVTPLGHASSCRICATVDTWAANRKTRLRASSGVVSPTAPTPHAGAVGVEATPDVRRRASGQLSG